MFLMDHTAKSQTLNEEMGHLRNKCVLEQFNDAYNSIDYQLLESMPSATLDAASQTEAPLIMFLMTTEK